MTATVLVAGAVAGSMYGVLALGYHLTYAVSRTVNFAQGSSLMLGAVLCYVLAVALGWPLWAAVLATVALCGAYGLAVERFAIRPFLQTKNDVWLLSTIAVGIIVENVALLTFGKESRAFPSPLTQSPIALFGVNVYPLELLIPAAGFAIAGLVTFALERTLPGKSFLAVAQNAVAARIIGIDVDRARAIAFLVSTALAGLAGILLAPLLNVSAGMGTIYGLKAYAVAIIGGLSSAWGVMFAGIAFGILEASIAAQYGAAYREILGFAVVITSLVLRPNGIFGRALVSKV